MIPALCAYYTIVRVLLHGIHLPTAAVGVAPAAAAAVAVAAAVAAAVALDAAVTAAEAVAFADAVPAATGAVARPVAKAGAVASAVAPAITYFKIDHRRPHHHQLRRLRPARFGRRRRG